MPPRISGNIDTIYSYFESPDDSVDLLSQRWNFLMEDSMPDGDRFALDFTGTWDRSSERDYINFFPSVGLYLEGDDYSVRYRYSRFLDKGFRNETGELLQEHWELDLRIREKVLDEVRFYIEENTAIDDFNPHFVNTDDRRIILGFAHEFEDLSFFDSLRITGQHWEERFENNVPSGRRLPLSLPVAVHVRGGKVYVADAGAGQIVVLTTGLSLVRTLSGTLPGIGPLMEPRGVAVDDQGRIYVSDAGQHRVVRLFEDGTLDRFWGTGASPAPGQFNQPQEIAIAPDGTVYVADTGNRRIQRLRPGASEFEVFVTGGLSRPTGVAVDSTGRVYFVDQVLDQVFRYTPDGSLDLSWGVPGAGPGEFNSPTSVTVDDSQFVYVADMLNNRIQKFTRDGVFLSQWGTAPDEGPLRLPQGIADDGGFIYVADTASGLIRKYDISGRLIQSSIDTQAGWTETSDDSFTTDFSLSPTDWWSMFGSYRVHRLTFDDSGGANAVTWTHDGTFQTLFDITPFWTLSGGGNFRYFKTDRETPVGGLPPATLESTEWDLDANEFVNTHLKLRENMDLGISHTESQSYDTGVKTAANRTTSAYFSSRFIERLDLDLRGSRYVTELHGQKDTLTDSWGYTLRGWILDETDITWTHDFSDSTQFLEEGDRDTFIQTGKLDINSQITRKLFGRLSYTVTKTESNFLGETTHTSFETIDLNLTHQPMSSLYTTFQVRHVIGDPGFLREWLFSGTLGWRWGDRYNLLVTYNDFRDGTRSKDISTRLTIRLHTNSTLELAYEIFDDKDAGTTETGYARFTVTF